MDNKTRIHPKALSHLLRGGLVAAALGLSLPSHALNIVISNDDGCEASTTHALYQALAAAGHNVLISASMYDQSGQGGSLPYLSPVVPIPTASRGGNLPAGTAGIATLAGNSAINYGERVFCVHSTPIGSTLHGIDVAARKVFGAPADLVLTGPNYGNNTGAINNISGTVNAALSAINRGVPAVAVSLQSPSNYRPFNVLQAGDIEHEHAALVVGLVDKLEQSAKGNALIPTGYGLNVNFPTYASGTGHELEWLMTNEGFAAGAMPFFVEDLGSTLIGKVVGLGNVHLPGIAVETPGLGDPAADGLSFIEDNDPESEQNVVDTGAIAVTVIRNNHQADLAAKNLMWKRLTGLVEAQELPLPSRTPAISETTLESR